jgi:hypothetical protein
MNLKQTEDLERSRAALSSVHRELKTVLGASPSRELAISERHLSEAIKALSQVLEPTEKTYTESERFEALKELNSGTDS